MRGITGTTHPIHIHGHTFQVIKIGWPVYNETTGEYMSNSIYIIKELVINTSIAPLCNKSTMDLKDKNKEVDLNLFFYLSAGHLNYCFYNSMQLMS